MLILMFTVATGGLVSAQKLTQGLLIGAALEDDLKAARVLGIDVAELDRRAAGWDKLAPYHVDLRRQFEISVLLLKRMFADGEPEVLRFYPGVPCPADQLIQGALRERLREILSLPAGEHAADQIQAARVRIERAQRRVSKFVPSPLTMNVSAALDHFLPGFGPQIEDDHNFRGWDFWTKPHPDDLVTIELDAAATVEPDGVIMWTADQARRARVADEGLSAATRAAKSLTAFVLRPQSLETSGPRHEYVAAMTFANAADQLRVGQAVREHAVAELSLSYKLRQSPPLRPGDVVILGIDQMPLARREAKYLRVVHAILKLDRFNRSEIVELVEEQLLVIAAELDPYAYVMVPRDFPPPRAAVEIALNWTQRLEKIDRVFVTKIKAQRNPIYNQALSAMFERGQIKFDPAQVRTLSLFWRSTPEAASTLDQVSLTAEIAKLGRLNLATHAAQRFARLKAWLEEHVQGACGALLSERAADRTAREKAAVEAEAFREREARRVTEEKAEALRTKERATERVRETVYETTRERVRR